MKSAYLLAQIGADTAGFFSKSWHRQKMANNRAGTSSSTTPRRSLGPQTFLRDWLLTSFRQLAESSRKVSQSPCWRQRIRIRWLGRRIKLGSKLFSWTCPSLRCKLQSESRPCAWAHWPDYEIVSCNFRSFRLKLDVDACENLSIIWWSALTKS